jgi:hypothetical protein
MDFISAPQNALARRCNLSVVALAPLLASSRRSATYRLENARPTARESRGIAHLIRGSPETLPRRIAERETRAFMRLPAILILHYSNLQVSRRSNEHATREKGTVS